MPPRPTLRSLTAGAVCLALVTTGLVTAAPVAAAPAEPAFTSLRAAIADGRSGLTELPRSTVRRAEAPVGALRSTAPAERLGSAPRASLTARPVSDFVVDYVNEGAVWSDQAKAAFESAVQVWERTVQSSVPIRVRAVATTFDDPSILGGAGPWDFAANTQGTSTLADDVFEPLALYNARTGRDVAPDEPDIEAEFNPSLSGLYFGTDDNPPADRIDFKTVVMHELGHGLGFVGSGSVDRNGRATIGTTQAPGRTGIRSSVSYDQFTYATTAAQAGNGGKRLLAMADGSAELKGALTGGSLYWAGQLGRTAAGGGKVRLYAPSEFFPGTSYGHLNEESYPGRDANGMMTPFIEPGEAYADAGQIAMGMLADMGYAVPALRGSRYTSLDPVRILDTREGIGAPKALVGAGRSVDVQVAGAHGVPADATAVVVNVTGVAPSEATDLRVYPTPVVLSPVPEISNLNLARGITRANLVTVPIGNNGRIRLRNSSGNVSMLADLAGFYAPTAQSTFTAADPVRLLDTRSQVGTDRTSRVGAGEFVDLAVSGQGSPVPAGAAAVALTVTAVSATAGTDVRAYPTPASADAAPPQVSNLNVRPGEATPNVVIVKVGQDGKVRLRNQAGAVHLLADVAGWYDASSTGSVFRPVTPTRILDTRSRLGTPAGSPTTVGPGEVVVLRVGSRGQVPALATAAVLNVTGVAATAGTDVRVYPANATSVPTVSNLNLTRGQTAADLVVVKLSNGLVRLRNNSGQVALLADVAGWFGPAT